MSKEEEIKQALAAATASHESMHNRNPYFTNQQLEELSEYFKTIPVDEEGHPYEPEYNSMAVRSDVLKMISDVWQARRKQYEVEFERDRLHDENQSLRRSLTSEAVKDANYNFEIMRLRKELEEARKIKFPRQPNGEGGWTIKVQLLDEMSELIDSKLGYAPDAEQLEEILLMIERILVGQEGEGNQRTIEVTLTNAGYKPPNGNQKITKVLTVSGVQIHYVPHEWDGFDYTVRATVEATCLEIYKHCVKNKLSEFNYDVWVFSKS